MPARHGCLPDGKTQHGRGVDGRPGPRDQVSSADDLVAGPRIDSRSRDLARYDMVILQDRYASVVPQLRALHTDAILLTTTNSCELFLDSSASPPAWANVDIAKVPNEWLLTQVGSQTDPR